MISYSDASNDKVWQKHWRYWFQTLPGMISYSDLTAGPCQSLEREVFQTLPGMISYSDFIWIDFRNKGKWKFQTLPGMISYSDSRKQETEALKDDCFKPFQGWFPILTRRMERFSVGSWGGFKPFQGWFPILTLSDGNIRGERRIKGFKPFQGWFPILTGTWERIPARSAGIVSNPSRDDFLFWRRTVMTIPAQKGMFQTLPGMISYSDIRKLIALAIVIFVCFKPFQGWFPILTKEKIIMIEIRKLIVSNPSRDDFLFWPCAPFKVSPPWFIKFQTLPGMISYSDQERYQFINKGEHIMFQTLPGMISYSDLRIRQIWQ